VALAAWTTRTRRLIATGRLTTVVLCCIFACQDVIGSAAGSRMQRPFPARDLTIKGIYGTGTVDDSVYCLIGNGECLIPQDGGTADVFIANWLTAHPDATVIPISSEAKLLPRGIQAQREVFVWIEDGLDSLSLSLVREGFYSAQAMTDMVDAEKRMTDMEGKTLARDERTRAQLEKRRSRVPEEDRPRRLISDADYAERMRQVLAAEHDAKQNNKGRWAAAKQAVDASTIDRLSRESFPVQDLYVRGTSAHRRGDPDIYCLLGGDACVSLGLPLLLGFGKDVAFVSRWLAEHPHAIVTPMSVESRKVFTARPPVHSTYVWVEDGQDSLNVGLVRAGIFRAQAMIDMVDARRNFMKMFDDPRLAAGRAEVVKEQAEEQPPERLISDSDYSKRMQRLAAAEQQAEESKSGLWSDSEIRRWKPPTDAQMLQDYAEHRPWFDEFASLVHAEPRLAEITRDPESWAHALSTGVPQEKIDRYVHVLEELHANETLSGVLGMGNVCLVVADITVGLFDNGVIKGYVLAPPRPQPLVKDLENWPQDLADATTAYKLLADGWYLFEIHH
jgi:endonuclease YncB( thermonuclease family)